MKTLTSRITSKGQATIPVEIRRKLKVAAGDRIAFRVFEDHVEIAPATSIDLQFAQMLEPTLASEWLTEEDEAAYGNL
ncbi:MAG: AbrB/MazE/SpoVT family DNA-binding domain-containing protein [Opitutales bacterium]|nr:AbrB/MazE/SpoVT family DNA-binding domain-containing protein [Opitutales bacterium]